MFRHILNFMRTGRPILPENFQYVDLLLEEAKYFELPGILILSYPTVFTRGYPRPSVLSHQHSEKNPEEYQQWNYEPLAATQVEGEPR